jgi:hypothetical protein
LNELNKLNKLNQAIKSRHELNESNELNEMDAVSDSRRPVLKVANFVAKCETASFLSDFFQFITSNIFL